MKKILTIQTLILLLICLLGCSKQASIGNRYKRDSERYEQQKKSNDGTDAGKYGKTALSTTFGIAFGVGIGAAIGVTIGTATLPIVVKKGRRKKKLIAGGGIVGAVIGAIVVGSPAGCVLGNTTYKYTNGEVSEYINVETTLTYTNVTNKKKMLEAQYSPYIFGSLDPMYQKNNKTPFFEKNDKVKLDIAMNAQIIPEKAKKASKRQKSPDLLIPVEIQIDKSSIEDGTLSINLGLGCFYDDAINVSEIVDSKQIFRFFIKNDPFQTPYVELKFVSAGVGEAKIRIIYGEPDYKIVLSSCDIAQTIEFTDLNESGE